MREGSKLWVEAVNWFGGGFVGLFYLLIFRQDGGGRVVGKKT